MVEGSGRYAFKRITWSLVRDGTRLKTVIEGVPQGCFLTVSDYAREVLDGKRQTCYGLWFGDRAVFDPDRDWKRA